MPCRVLARLLERERTAPSLLGMARKDGKKKSKKKIPKKKMPWVPSEVKLVFAQLMIFGAPHVGGKAVAKPPSAKNNYTCKDFHLTPEQWVAKAGVDLQTKTSNDVHQFVLQLLHAVAQVNKDTHVRSAAKSAGTATTPAPDSTIFISAPATKSKPEAGAHDTDGAPKKEDATAPGDSAPAMIKVSRSRLKQLDGRLKLLQEFRCKVLSRPEAALLRNLRNVKNSKMNKSKLAPKWWSLRHDVKLLLGKAACVLTDLLCICMSIAFGVVAQGSP